MATDRIAVAQRGRVLADAVGDTVAPRARTATGARKPRKSPRAAGVLSGPFLSPGSLSRAERLRLIEGIEAVIDGVYTHLPLKRARYGTDPVQRLRILRSQVDELTDDAFHLELADLVTRLRDAHTRYAGPVRTGQQGCCVAIPGRDDRNDERADVRGDKGRARVGDHVPPWRRAGVLERHADRSRSPAVQRVRGRRPSRQSAGLGNTESHAALVAIQPPTRRALGDRRLSLDDHHRHPDRTAREVKIPWQVIDPSQIVDVLSGGPTGRVPVRLRRARAIDPAAAAIRQAKMLLFAPAALTGGQAAAPKRAGIDAQSPSRGNGDRHHADPHTQSHVDRCARWRVRLFAHLRLRHAARAIHQRAHPPHPIAAGARADPRCARQSGWLHLGGGARAATVHTEAHPAHTLLVARHAVHT